MIRRVIAIVPLLVCLSCPALAADDAALRQPIDGFYWVHQQSSQDGIPDATQRARYAPYISPDLAMLLIEADTAATRFTLPPLAAPTPG